MVFGKIHETRGGAFKCQGTVLTVPFLATPFLLSRKLPYIKGLFGRVLTLKTVLEHQLHHGAAVRWSWDSINVFGRAQAPTFLTLSHCHPGPVRRSLHSLPPVWSIVGGARPDAPTPMTVRWRLGGIKGRQGGEGGQQPHGGGAGLHSGMSFAR